MVNWKNLNTEILISFIPKDAMMYIDSMAIVKNSPNKEMPINS